MHQEGWMVMALMVSQGLGYAMAFIGRILPFIPNRVVPKIGFITILLANIGLLWNKFVESAGWLTAGLFGDFHSDVAYAGFFGALGKQLVAALATAGMSMLQYWLNRKGYVEGASAVTSKFGETKQEEAALGVRTE